MTGYNANTDPTAIKIATALSEEHGATYVQDGPAHFYSEEDGRRVVVYDRESFGAAVCAVADANNNPDPDDMDIQEEWDAELSIVVDGKEYVEIAI